MKHVHLTAAALLLLALDPSVAKAAIACADLAKSENQPSDVTIAEAVETPPGDEVSVAHCLVRGKTPDRQGIDGKTYAIRFELRLPVEWNERFVHQFNGGNDGAVVPALGPLLGGRKSDTALARGYAVVSSDAGHDGKANPDRGLAGGAAFGFDPQARRDYGYGAVATLQPLAEEIVEKHYGKPIAYRYGIGSSNGGRHGMMAAERMPEVFDGLLVGYPGFNLPKAAIQHPLDIQAWSKVDADIAKAFGRDDLKLVADGVLAACDSLDGVSDGIVADADACETTFKFETLACESGANTGCLRPEQIEALKTSVAGPKDAEGRALYTHWIFDTGIASGNWRTWKLESPIEPWGNRPIIGVMGAASLAQVFTTPPTEVGGTPDELIAFLRDFDVVRDGAKIAATDDTFTESAMDFMVPPGADDPRLDAFREAGSKMLVFHGNSDPVFSVVDTVDWYKKLDANHDGKASDFVKFYRIPGMPHGASGPSFNDFDFFTPLVDWVEQGNAPSGVAAGITEDNAEAATLEGTRFLYCPYPAVTRAADDPSAEGEGRYICR
ncbi:tannase/feruloyl esterase family alpha/beta hydrolase [Rhizobium rosettiformans]|uniref:Tannase/feruloyl esterase family alpha/beta hydrolase n=1 Tax=Rhizobium rosettiformans TaxID=1368430 RepID=A0ABX7F0M4_9HYPH|nr:tannase/feruloyl esterase family alpha/beta hydrolase [Rhizobium rosettiformans]QRF53237.1 tannase/feruloyl esterase family alpha/beta hydrolase [Rhizobium rosettiformans]